MDYNIHMNKNIQGFTLIELIVTMAVVSIVLLTGMPALNDMTASNRLVTQINSIAGSLALARSEAIKTGSVVTICASSDSATCNVTTWHSGWIAFTDVDKDTVVDSGTDKIIQVQDPLTGGTTLKLTLNNSLGVSNVIAGFYQFLPDGSSRDQNTGGLTTGTFVLCNQANEDTKAKAININYIGRTSRAEDSDSNNIVEYYNYVSNTKVDVACP